MVLIYLSVAWVAGIWLGSEIVLHRAALFLGFLPLPLLFLAPRFRKPIIWASLCLFLVFGGAVYYQFRLPFAAESHLPPEWMLQLRNTLARVLAEILPEPQASLAQGIVLGIRSNISRSLLADFNHTGTTHILAISGQNLSIIAGILVSFGIWLFGRRHHLYIWLTLGIIWLYALLTGMNPPVLRATIMASLFLAAELLGRQRSAGTALFFAAAVMVGIRPAVLSEASFQMSFMAMAGLIYIFPLLQSLGRKAIGARLGGNGIIVSIANFIVDSFSVSLGAVIGVWPLIAHYFGIISWIGPVATLLALPALPGIIVTGALAGFLGLIALPVAQVIGWLAWLFLSYMLLVVKVFSGVPFTEGVQIDTAFVWGYYSVLALVIWLSSKGNMARVKEWLNSAVESAVVLASRLPVKWVVPSLSVAAILVWVTVLTLPDDNLHASFLDVGQGDATLFQKGTQQILIDGGPNEQTLMIGLGKEMPFWDRTIDLLILTHPHADHLTGLIGVLKRYRVKQVLYADLADKSAFYDEWLRLIEEKGIKFAYAQTGQRITFGTGVVAEVMNTQGVFSKGNESDMDNNGVVVRLEMGQVSFLVTGDMQWQGESELVTQRANLGSTVLRVGHHGSVTSTSPRFLGVVNPRITVISVGRDNEYGHPHQVVMDRLREKLGQEYVYRTDERGRIELITDGTKLWVRTER